jgi:DNA transposition AAA+ family ATPase
MTRAARRRTAALQVYLSRAESEQWLEVRTASLASFRTQARERGRKLVVVYSDTGALLEEVAA